MNQAATIARTLEFLEHEFGNWVLADCPFCHKPEGHFLPLHCSRCHSKPTLVEVGANCTRKFHANKADTFGKRYLVRNEKPAR